MNIFESLGADHQLIARVVDAFERFLDRADGEGGLDRDDLHGFVDFFVDFSDGQHHQKEEDIVLPALVRAGFSWDEEPLTTVRREHRQERYLIEVLSQAVTQKNEHTTEDRRRIASVGRELVDFLRGHMKTENERLFPAGSQKLTEEAMQSAAERLSKFEAAVDADEARRLRDVAETLTARYAL